ncbi:transposase [Pectobacterium brasiliense]|uniref:transposase n=1 Tax=Pectobacterium brasiliense TaxID=180957 RepID=UPI002152C974|nr:transposase [Pectobacterium brasiliense]
MENIPDIGPLGASALTIVPSNSRDFNNGLHFASYLGFVPSEHSNNSKTRFWQ